MPAYEQASSSWTGVLVVVGEEQLLFPMSRVREIIQLPKTSRVPGMMSWFKGIANLRGTLFPVIDLATMVDIENNAQPLQQRCLVLENNGFPLGVIVDSVRGMKNFMQSESSEEIPAIDARLEPLVGSSFQDADTHLAVVDIQRLTAHPGLGSSGIRLKAMAHG